ncbi:MAG: family 43 glycosylhydrolase [Ignavibacteriae bacterium]|nr:family 43 glycosylhydrolase [Ignavibacteriota bacterium]
MPWLAAVALALTVLPALCNAQSSGITTYCNPVDLDYRYNWEQSDRKISYRSGADPVMVYHRGTYYLFATISGGWWRSPDMLHWQFVEPNVWPVDDNCAPAGLFVRDTFYLFQSAFTPRPVYWTTNLDSGSLHVFTPRLEVPSGAAGPWDPGVYHDEETDRWYLYWGSSNVYPLWGIELDHAGKFSYRGTAKALITLHPDQNGWERFGRDHTDPRLPFMEGAWMTKHDGKYYLQYGAPGTEYNVYANGVYVGDDPLGPFVYAPNNPISYKPGGFVTGAGHGNTFQDRYGNYWNTGTPWIAVNWDFERRIAQFPAAFDRDGLLHASTRFGDLPHRLPSGPVADPAELFAGWMLLSYRKAVTATGYAPGHAPIALTDEDPRTYWLAENTPAGQWVILDLGAACTVRALQVNYTDHQSGIYRMDSTVYTQFRIFASVDSVQWNLIADLSHEKRDRPNAYIELPAPVHARYIRYEHLHVSANHLAISDIRVFGQCNVPLPAVAVGLTVRRHEDERDATISWDPVPGVVGYNILWGIAPDKLYQTSQVFADRPCLLELRALTVGQGYHVAIEAFNEAGVSRRSEVVALPTGSRK